MSRTTIRWPLAKAQKIAEVLVELLGSSCERIVIAGSIRRGKGDVGDIELVCVPRAIIHPTDELMFLDYLPQDELDRAIKASSLFIPRPSITGTITYGPKNKLLIHRLSGIPVDIFSTTAKNWGMSLLVRTGPAAFNIRIMARLKALGTPGHAYGGITAKDGSIINCPTEEDVFKALGWVFIAPERRE